MSRQSIEPAHGNGGSASERHGIRILVVDADGHTSRDVRKALKPLRHVEVLGAQTASAALAMVRSSKPEIVVADLEQPGSAELLRVLLESSEPPRIIALMAAGGASEGARPLHARVVLEKPIQRERLTLALLDCMTEMLPGTEEPPRKAKGADQHICVRAGRRFVFVDAEEIRWIEAAGNYVRLHTTTGSVLARITLKALLARLDPASFRRIHRGTVVNLSRVREVRARGRGGYVARMADGSELRVSRSYARGLLRQSV